ncbi:MAG: amidase [Pseudomonadales bacterium]
MKLCANSIGQRLGLRRRSSRCAAPGRAAILLCSLAAALSGCSAPEPRFDVTEADIDALQTALRAGTVSCEAIVDGYLARIAAYDKATGLNAITVTNPGAVARAREIDARLANGQPLGELFCVPVLVKDNFDTHDLPTTGGSIAMAGSLPPDDAFMVRRLREADAIVLAKTNMAEWAFSARQTRSSSYGVTANAYALDRVPAGSSGGTASGVAASFGAAGLGSDTGNSIRGPSSHLALFGIRSTLGLTSRDGVIPLAWDRDVAGPMTRSVRDGARLFNVLAGFDPDDPMTRLGRNRKAADYTEFLDPEGLRGARIGVLRALVDTEDADPRVTALFQQALEDLAAAGAELTDPVIVPDLAAHLAADNFCPRFRYDLRRYLDSLGEAALIGDLMDAYDKGLYSDYVRDRILYFGRFPADLAPDRWDQPCPTYPAHPGRRAYLDAVLAAMDAARVEVLVYPTWTNPPAHLNRPVEEYLGDNSQLVAPATGMPAATVPMGFVDGTLPAGLQILARPFDEPAIFRIAFAYEQRTRHRRPPPLFPPLPPDAP